MKQKSFCEIVSRNGATNRKEDFQRFEFTWEFASRCGLSAVARKYFTQRRNGSQKTYFCANLLAILPIVSPWIRIEKITTM